MAIALLQRRGSRLQALHFAPWDTFLSPQTIPSSIATSFGEAVRDHALVKLEWGSVYKAHHFNMLLEGFVDPLAYMPNLLHYRLGFRVAVPVVDSTRDKFATFWDALGAALPWTNLESFRITLQRE